MTEPDYRLVPVADFPDGDRQAEHLFTEHWPAFIFHDYGVKPYLTRRVEYFADLDFYLVEGDSRLIGGGWGVPIRWDGAIGDLPAGYTESLARSVEGHEQGVEPDTFVVMGAMVRSDEQGRGWAGRLLAAMRDAAGSHGLEKVIAPVRPTRKSSYPITPIEKYAHWRREDGSLFDPWLRTHERAGASVLAGAPRSQTMTGSVADWEKWSGLDLPASGDYVFPEGLAVLHVDRPRDTGTYHEPNVWMRHL